MDVGIVGRECASSGIGQHAQTLLQSLKSFGTTAFYRFEIPRRPADLMIYTDVLCNGFFGREKIETFCAKKDALKFAYVVFDSDEAPPDWVQIINDHLDGILVPSEFIRTLLTKSGVTRPIFLAPLALDLRPYLVRRGVRPPPSPQRPLHFGFVGAFHPRKRIDRLVSAFTDAFGTDAREARLTIHSNTGFDDEFEKISRMVERLGGRNIFVTREELEPAAYEDLIASFDGYVSFSAGEGFNIPARQALAAGAPLLLSNTTAHEELIDQGLARGVAARIPTPAYYQELDKRYYGLQYDVSLNEAAADWRRFAADIRAGAFKADAERTRAYCEGLDLTKAKYRFFGMTNVTEASLDQTNAIDNFSMKTTDPRLVDKIRVIKRRRPEKRMVVMAHDGGFFSVFNTYLSHLVWNQGKNGVTHVLPDWRIGAMQKFWKTDSFTSFCYGRPQDGNVWLKLFEPVYDDIDPAAYETDALLYKNSPGPMHSFNGEKEPLLTYVHAYELYRRPDFKEWRQWYGAYLKRYIRPSAQINAAVDRVRERAGDAFVIGMHVRHPSHAMEQPGQKIAGFDRYIDLARDLIKTKKGQIGDNWKIFLATDQDRTVKYFEREFGDRLVTVSDVARTTETQDAGFDSLTSTDKLKEGFQIQHLMASDPSRWNSKLAEEVIIDAILLSKCDTFVHTTSNVATAVSVLGPDVEMIYCK